MQCPQCRHENREGAKFCNECATPLSLRCPFCETLNPPGAKFCDECATPLTTSTSASTLTRPTPHPAATQDRDPASYTPQYLAEKILTSRSALEGERKQVTVMFADIKDSTELIRDLDPEAAQQLLDPAIHIMMNAVHRFEGTVNQVLGDGIMAIFGAPIAHEDHAARACYAALAIQAAMQPYADQVRRGHGIEIRIRVGLNSGEVVVRNIGNDLHMDYSAVGPTVHLAARMEQMATPGSTRFTSTTLRLVEGMVQANALGPIPIKGMTEPVEVYELTGVSTIKRRLQAAVARGLTRFVGRDHEIESLKQAQVRAEAGNGQIVAIVGEAGVGKSRLAYEFIHSHRAQGWLVLESASVSYGKATPYFPVTDLLKRYVHIEDGDEPRTIRAKVTGQILTLDESLQATIPALLALLDALPEDDPFLQLDPRQRRQQTLDGLKRILLRESQVQPLLLVFEDLHWIDSETQALLDNLVESLPTAQLLLLVNYRPEYQHGWGSKTYYTQLRLDPLPPESADAFLEALLGDDPALEPLKKLLIERTEGNPFFLEESVRMLVETEVLVGDSGAYRLAQELPTIQVPPTVQAILAARIDRLPQDEKRLLQTAAVIGSEVPLALLQAITELSEDELHRGLSQLQAAEFLYETCLFPERVYTFKHALTHNVAYQSLLTSTRQRYHHQVAQVLETRPETVETQPELLAHHYTEAGRDETAIEYWQRAGQRALQGSAHLEAIAHLKQGLIILTTLPETPERLNQELDFQVAFGASLIATKGNAHLDVERAYARARELCQLVGKTQQIFPVLRGLMLYHMNRGDVNTALQLGEELLDLAQSQSDPEVLMLAHSIMGVALYTGSELDAARTQHRQVLSIYNSQEYREPDVNHSNTFHAHVSAYYFLAIEMWPLGYPDQAVKYHQEALRLAQVAPRSPTLATAQCFVAILYQWRREPQAVQDLAEAAITLSTAQGFSLRLAQGKALHGWALAMQGHGEQGIAEIRQGLAIGQSTGDNAYAPHMLGLLAEAYGESGYPEEGLNTLSEVTAVLDTTGSRWYEAELHRLKGVLLLQQAIPDAAQAEACFHQALDIARQQQAKSFELRAATSLARLWQSQGKRHEAHDLLAPVYGWFTEGFDTADLKEAKALLEELS